MFTTIGITIGATNGNVKSMQEVSTTALKKRMVNHEHLNQGHENAEKL